LRIQTVGPIPGEQTRNKFGTIGGKFKKDLIHQLHVEIPVPDIDNERHRRFQRCDICEVLLRAHTHVDTSLLGFLQKLGNHVLEIQFVGQKVVGTKGTVLL
jgi:hypothetical protein